MSVIATSKFLYKIDSGRCFSAQAHNMIFIENSSLATTGESRPPLLLREHYKFIADVLAINSSSCMWFVETANEIIAKMLQNEFPNCLKAKCSIAGTINCDLYSIQRFLKIHQFCDAQKPWTTESPWGLVGMQNGQDMHLFQHTINSPWTVPSILSKGNLIQSIFLQEGWFAYMGFKRENAIMRLAENEFPQIKLPEPV